MIDELICALVSGAVTESARRWLRTHRVARRHDMAMWFRALEQLNPGMRWMP